jgi:DNA repair protein RadC
MTYDKHTSPMIKHPADIVPILQAWLASEDQIDQDKEHFWSVGLSGSHQVVYVELVTLGLVNQSHVHPRETFRQAIQSVARP